VYHSRLLPAWRLAGWLTGALPALAGPRAVYATIAAVEDFVDRHYAEQIERLDAMPCDPRRAALRADLERCRLDELAHRDEALGAGPGTGALLRLWTGSVGRGSAAAVALARRV
jgi:ubiquinone biosynthesis monooxygenase Coq7